MIQAVIFDMDGVLVDTEKHYMDVLGDFFVKWDIKFKKNELFSLIGSNSRRTYQLFVKPQRPEWDYDTYMRIFKEFKQDIRISYHELMMPGVSRTLSELTQKGYRLGLASSTGMAGIEAVLEQCQLKRYFESILSGDMFRESKPHPEIYLRSAERLGLLPKECAAVEDSPHGIRAARAAGMYVFALKDQEFGLDQSEAHFMINQIPELPDRLAAMKGGE